MDANRALIPHPGHPRSGPPTAAFSTMLALLETLRNLILSGHEPAAYLIAPLAGGSLRMSTVPYPAASNQPAFRVGSRTVAGGHWLEVTDESGRTGYRLEQFCRSLPSGKIQALPYVWYTTERPRPAWTPGEGVAYLRAFSTACLARTR
jgi:hypothetical protein